MTALIVLICMLPIKMMQRILATQEPMNRTQSRNGLLITGKTLNDTDKIFHHVNRYRFQKVYPNPWF